MARDSSVFAVYRNRVYDGVRYYAESAWWMVARTVRGLGGGGGVVESGGTGLAVWGCHVVLGGLDWGWGILEAEGRRFTESVWHVVLEMAEAVNKMFFEAEVQLPASKVRIYFCVSVSSILQGTDNR